MRKLLLALAIGLISFSFNSCDNESIPNSGSSKQCAATTQKGTRCKRNAAEGSIYCWQHKK